MVVLKKLQNQLSLIRNLRFESPIQRNITNMISNFLFLGVLFTYLISTSWYFIFHTDTENYMEYFESRYFVLAGFTAIATYLEVFRTRNDYNQFFEDLNSTVEGS